MTLATFEQTLPASAASDRRFGGGRPGIVPGSRIVPDLTAAIDALRRRGMRLASEIRTAPGIASWAFVANADGQELLLWQNAG